MTTYNTGNPIGSKDPRDLYDNAENLDEAVNTRSAESWNDRFGVARKTWWGMEQEFDSDQSRRENEFESAQTYRESRFNDFIASSGYQFLGDYAAGIEITEYNQIVRDADGEFWRLSGQVELPYTTTGEGLPEDDALTPLGDAVLRQQLDDINQGAALLGRGVVAVDSISDLLSLPAGQRKADLQYLVKGYHQGSDVGGGELYWDASSTTEPNGVTVFGSGPVGRFVRKTKGAIDITLAGAIPDFDGVTGTDNTDAIQRAINVGRSIFVPVGNFAVVSGNIDVPSDTYISGESKTASVITFLRETSDVSSLQYIFKSHLAQNITIRDLHLTAKTTYNTGTGDDSYTGRIHGVLFDKVENIQVLNVKVSEFNFNGILFRNSPEAGYETYYSKNVLVDGCSFHRNRSTGLRVESVKGIVISNCDTFNNGIAGDKGTGYGINIGGLTGGWAPLSTKQAIVQNCIFRDENNKGLDAHNIVDLLVDGCYFINCDRFSCAVYNSMPPEDASPGSITITNCLFDHEAGFSPIFDGNFIYSRTGTDISLDDNPVKTINISDNVFKNKANVGEYIIAHASKHVGIINNHIVTDYETPANLVDALSHNVFLTGNYINVLSSTTDSLIFIRHVSNTRGAIAGNTIINGIAGGTAINMGPYRRLGGFHFNDNSFIGTGLFAVGSVDESSFEICSNNLVGNSTLGSSVSSANSTALSSESAVIGSTASGTTRSRAAVLASDQSSVNGFSSTVLSSELTAVNGDSSVAIGSSRVAINDNFSVGGGWSDTGGPSTANIKWLVSSTTGDVSIAGVLTQNAAFTDIAKMFENHALGEIPVGTIVSLRGRKCAIAQPEDDILGVHSRSYVQLLGDSEFTWRGRYLRGDFGELLTKTDEEGNTVYIENPDFDPSQSNQPRSKRPEEWTPVGILGEVFVRVGSDCAVGQYIQAGEGGVGATANGPTKLRLMEITKPYSEEEGYAIGLCLIC